MKLIMKINLLWLRPLVEEVVTKCFRLLEEGRQFFFKCCSAKMMRLY